MTSGARSAEEVGRLYDEWLSGGGGPSAIYARWYLRRRFPREYERLLEALGAPAPRLLDVGCATGVALELADKRGWGREILAGVDASGRALAEARKRLSQLGPRALLLHGAADALPFEAGSFDTVTCNGVIKYLDDAALARLLAEALRVLVPGGALALGEFGPRVTERFAGVWRVTAIEQWTLRSAAAVEAALGDAGFSAIQRVEIRRIRRFPYSYEAAVSRKMR